LGQPERLREALARTSGLPQTTELLQDCLTKLCQSRLLLISGGPGSGKTTLLSSLLRILRRAEQDSESWRKLEWVLCAPTARAAQRMLQSMDIAGDAAELPKAQTLHKLLGLGWSAAEFYRPATRDGQAYLSAKGVGLLRLDILVLDEASMLDSEMAYRLFQRLHPQTHVILIGDPQQLPPVGLGAFWKDLLASGTVSHCLIELQGSHRSTVKIRELGESVLQGEGPSSLLKAAGPAGKTISWHPIALSANSEHNFLHYLWQNWCPHPPNIRGNTEEDIEPYFQWLRNYTILSPLQRGTGGAQAISQRLLQYAKQGFSGGSGFFHGCPLQITRNDYRLGLYNGDRGFCLDFNSQLYGVFAKESDEQGEPYLWMPMAHLAHCEASFVQTIHKSQGSEYLNVCVLLPEQVGSWSKPLLYTAITRAKEHICFVGSEAALEVLDIMLRQTGRNEPLSLFGWSPEKT
ncbi:MAG: AAA family ATPase, partial [Spirochaetota bacterium]